MNFFNASRSVNGVLFLDKISGISSASLLHELKVIFQAKKAGHTGTLDPLATGMLPICFGEATKFSQYLLKSDKSYRVTAKLGVRTNTFDSSGSVVCVRPIIQLNRLYLNRVLDDFIGRTYQIPPIFSALKYCGCPLYQYARKGICVLKKPRLINIYKIELIKLDNGYIELELYCSTGTYIRTFIDDLGERLGCGAHIVALRRLSIAQFSSELMINVNVLRDLLKKDMHYSEYLQKIDKLLYPIDVLVSHFPEINVSPYICRLLKFGQKISVNELFGYDVWKINTEKNNILVRMTVGCERKFFGIGSIINKSYLLVNRLIICSN